MDPELGRVEDRSTISLLDLPDELLVRILGDNSLDGYEGSSATRGSLMLVNRSIGALAAEAHYRNLIFSQYHANRIPLLKRLKNGGWYLGEFARTINECPHYASLVRHIYLAWYEPKWDMRIHDVLGKLQGLQSLRLGSPVYGQPIPPPLVMAHSTHPSMVKIPAAFSFFEQNSMPSLQKVYFSHIAYDEIHKFMFLPSLRTVCAYSFDSNPGKQQLKPGTELSPSSSRETRSSLVAQIELSGTNLYDAELGTFLSCPRHLKVLKIAGRGLNFDIFSPARLQSLLEPLKQSLVELHTCGVPEDVCKAEGDGTHIDFSEYTAMRVLVVPHMLLYRNDQPWCKARFYERLPPNLEALKITMGKAPKVPSFLPASREDGSLPEYYSWVPGFARHMATYLPYLRRLETRYHSCEFCGRGGQYRWTPSEAITKAFEEANIALDVV